MSVLVTGGAGYIGSHVVLSLLDRGEDVVVIDRLSTGFRQLVHPRAHFYEGDIADAVVLALVFRQHQVDAIIHFAGSIIVPESVVDPLAYYDNNTSRSRALIAAAVEHGICNFVFSSTAAVYGTPNDGQPVDEDAPVKPESPYGTSKLMTELMLRDTAKAYNLRYTALRYFNVAGADPLGRTGQSTPAATHLIKVGCEVVTGKRPFLSIFGDDYSTPDGTCVRDYIHVSDLADAHLKALDRMRSGQESIVLNCGYGLGYSVLEVVDCIKRVAGRDFEVRRGPRRRGDADFIVADATAARVKLGWEPKFADLEFIVQSALAWEEKLDQMRSSMVSDLFPAQ